LPYTFREHIGQVKKLRKILAKKTESHPVLQPTNNLFTEQVSFANICMLGIEAEILTQ